jgi:hypothetical protein
MMPPGEVRVYFGRGGVHYVPGSFGGRSLQYTTVETTHTIEFGVDLSDYLSPRGTRTEVLVRKMVLMVATIPEEG